LTVTGTDETLRDFGLAHERGAALAGDDALGRAAHVDVDERRADRDGDLGGVVHHVLLATEDLDAELAAVERGRELAGRLLVARRQRVRRQELRDREADAELLGDGAERQIRDRRHRGEDHGNVDVDRTDTHGTFVYRNRSQT
jgi:hypothetical protein